MRDRQADFEARKSRLVVIGLGDPEYARGFRDETRINFMLLADVNREAYRAASLRTASAIHMLRPHNVFAAIRAQSAGHRQGSKGPHPFQLGGSFVFGPGNVDRYAHVSQTFGDNAPVAALLSALDP